MQVNVRFRVGVHKFRFILKVHFIYHPSVILIGK